VYQELTEVTERTRKVVDETDSSRSLPLEYDSQLREALDKMRQEMEDRIRQTHDDTEAFYERKVCIGNFLLVTSRICLLTFIGFLLKKNNNTTVNNVLQSPAATNPWTMDILSI